MVCSVSNIKKDVRNVLAENESIEPLLQDSGILDDELATERDTLIENLICKAVDRVHVAAPYTYIRDIEERIDQWGNTDEYAKTLELPTSFLRLGFVRLNNWRVPVYTATDADSAEYIQARSPFNIMRPSPRHPMVAIIKDAKGLMLEAYPKCAEGTNVCFYVPKSKIYTPEGGTPSVDIAEQCYYAVIYMIANLYYVSINEADKAKAMAEEVADILNGEEIFNK